MRTESISYPRSGHGALYHVLRRYFGSQFNYCAPMQTNNCGCESVPCPNPATNFSKNHDFGAYKDDGIVVRPDQRYLIQFRNPVRSIVSNHYLYLAENPEKDSREQWYRFAHKGIVYWNKLIDKWVLEIQHDPDMLMVCPYEELVLHPMATVSQVIAFMTGEEVKKRRLRQVISEVNIRPRNRYVDFPFFDEGFFRSIEELAGPRLEILGIPSFEESV